MEATMPDRRALGDKFESWFSGRLHVLSQPYRAHYISVASTASLWPEALTISCFRFQFSYCFSYHKAFATAIHNRLRSVGALDAICSLFGVSGLIFMNAPATILDMFGPDAGACCRAEWCSTTSFPWKGITNATGFLGGGVRSGDWGVDRIVVSPGLGLRSRPYER